MENAKRWAKDNLKGNKWNIWIGILILGFITGIVDSICNTIWKPEVIDVWNDVDIVVTSRSAASATSIINLLLSPLYVGFCFYLVNIVKGKKFQVEQLFSKFNNYLRTILAIVMMGIIIAISFCLLIVPGIIAALALALVMYLLADERFKNLSAMEIIKKSAELTKGHKMELFLFILEYFVKFILSVFTLGIWLIWLIPEYNLIVAKFATDLIDENK